MCIRDSPHIKVNGHATQTQLLNEATAGADMILVLTDHNEFKELDPTDFKSDLATPIVLDTKNCLQRDVWEEQGFAFYTLGDAKNRNVMEQIN